MTIAHRLLVFALLAFTSIAHAADADFFPIMAWNHAPPDPAVLKKMRDCGLTVAGFVAPQHLDLVHAAGMKAIAGDFMAGDFTHADGSRWVMLVNRDMLKSHPAQPNFRPAKSVRPLSPYTGELVPFEGEQIWLAPGAGALLKIEK